MTDETMGEYPARRYLVEVCGRMVPSNCRLKAVGILWEPGGDLKSPASAFRQFVEIRVNLWLINLWLMELL